MTIKRLSFLTILFFFGLSFSFAQDSRDTDYIRKYAKIAVEEMHLYKIPASITLSQGILETGGGQSRLAEQANNHFGIKCKPEWTGMRIYHDDDAKGECFRKYNSVEESYRDHSKFLAERPYYKNLFNLELTDYKAWAHGLKKAGYATNPKYASILISRIEKYKLHEFDLLHPEEVNSKLVELFGISESDLLVVESAEEPEIDFNSEPKIFEPIQETIKIEIEKRIESPEERLKKHPNGQNYIVVNSGENISTIAKIYNVKASKLQRYNELGRKENLTSGQFLFFGNKKNKSHTPTYTVQEGDNMYLISQKMGIKINKLYSLNKMNLGSQPKVGEVLNLQKRKK